MLDGSGDSANVSFTLYELLFPNDKRYFGITSFTAEKRFSGHVASAIKRGSKFPVHAAIRKYGVNSVVVKTLVVGNQRYIRDMEIKAIQAFKTCNREFGYNLSFGGEISPMHNPEVAERVSKILKLKGAAQTAAARAACIGIPMSDDAKVKSSISHKLWWESLSKEERDRRNAHLADFRGFMKGKKFNEKATENIRKAAKNRSPDWLVNLTLALQQMEFTPARAKQLADARAKVDPSKRIETLLKNIVGSVWITDGEKSRRVKKDYVLPDGWYYGRPDGSTLSKKYGLSPFFARRFQQRLKGLP